MSDRQVSAVGDGMTMKGHFSARAVLGHLPLVCALAVSLALGCLAGHSEAGDEVSILLQKMQQAEVGTSYEGELHVVQFSGTPKTLRYAIMRQGPNVERKEFLADQGGKLEVTLSDGKHTWTYMPSRRMVIKRPAPDLEEVRELRRKAFELIQQNYAVRVEQEEVNIGGRKAVVIELIPEDQSTRPIRRMWVDRESGVPLRTEVVGTDRSVVLLSYFSKISFAPRLPAEHFVLKVPKNTAVRPVIEKAYNDLEPVRSSVAFPVLTPRYLPKGFAFMRVLVRSHPREDEIQIQYSDGLSMLSLFQDRRITSSPSAPPGSPIARTRRPVAVGEAKGSFYDLGFLRLVEWKNKGNALALVGELEESEMLNVARSVE